MKKSRIVVASLICILLLSTFSIYASDIKDNNNKDTNTINVAKMTLSPGSYKQYDKLHLEKGDIISADLGWDNLDGNVYFAIGTSFGQFRGLQSSGNGNLHAKLTVNKEDDYFLFIGVQQTQRTDAKNIQGKIVINNSKKELQENGKSKTVLEDEKITMEQVSLASGSHEQYGPYLFHKGDKISLEINWNDPGNLYFAIGTEFGKFRGLKSSGRNQTSLNESIEVKEDGEYYIFLGIQGTEIKNIDGISGEIVYPVN